MRFKKSSIANAFKLKTCVSVCACVYNINTLTALICLSHSSRRVGLMSVRESERI